jgi:hypothetical protein
MAARTLASVLPRRQGAARGTERRSLAVCPTIDPGLCRDAVRVAHPLVGSSGLRDELSNDPYKRNLGLGGFHELQRPRRVRGGLNASEI